MASSLLAAFGSVTLIFALLERSDIEYMVLTKKKASWTPDMMDKQLSQEPKGKPYEHVFEIAMNVILLVVLNAFPEKIGFYYKVVTGKLAIIPIFDLGELSKFIWIINTILIVSIIYRCIRLLAGKQTLGLLIFHTLLKIAECVQLVFLYRFPGIWNTKLLEELNTNAVFTLKGVITYKGLEQGLDIFVGVIIVLSMIEIGKEIYYYVKKNFSMM